VTIFSVPAQQMPAKTAWRPARRSARRSPERLHRCAGFPGGRGRATPGLCFPQCLVSMGRTALPV